MRNLFSVVMSFEMLVVLYIYSGRIKALGLNSIAGIDITVLVASIVFGALAWGINRRVFSIQINKKYTIVFALVLVAYLLLTYTWSPMTNYSLRKLYYLATMVPLAYLAGLVCGSDEQRFERALSAILLFTIIYLVTAISVAGGWSSFSYNDLVTSINVKSEESISLYQQNSNLAAMAASAGLLLAYMTQNRQSRLMLILVVIALMFLTIHLGGRAGILRLMVVILMLLAFVGRHRIIKMSFLIVSVIAGISLLLLNTHYLVELAASELLPSGIARLIAITIEANLIGDGEARIGLGIAALNVWEESPVVGVGLGGYAIAAGFEWTAGYPHNVILEVMAEAGLVGLIFYSLFLVSHVRAVLQPVLGDGSDKVHIAKLVIFCVAFSVVMFSSDLTDRESPFFFGIIAASLAMGSSRYWDYGNYDDEYADS